MGLWRAVSLGLCVLILRTVYCKPTIRSLQILSNIRYRFATTRVNSTVVNDLLSAQEAIFEVTLPKEAFISNFSMLIDGQEYVGTVKEKEAAKLQYEVAKRRGQSAGHVQQKRARHSNKFEVAVNVAGGGGVTFYLTYEQMLTRCHGYYEHKVHINPGQMVSQMSVEVYIQENRDITMLRTPDIRNDILTDVDISAVNQLTVIERPTSSSAFIKYTPTLQQQANYSDTGINGQFIVQYEVQRSLDAGEIMVVDGYFVHFFAPARSIFTEPLPKDIIFIMDVSGSMTGSKIQQVKDAMTTIIDDLREGDAFNILAFNHDMKFWKTSLKPVNNKMVQEAKAFVSRMHAGGDTDIDGAFDQGLQFVIGSRQAGRTPIVFFLTDGQPTSGTQDPDIILANVRRNNEGVAAVFGLAFGSDADYSLLKRISAQNNGLARKIYAESDAAMQVEDFYEEISTTILKDVKFTYANSSVQLDSLTNSEFKNYFNGTELIVVGKTANNAIPQVVITGNVPQGTVNFVLDQNDIDSTIVDSLDGISSPHKNPFFTMPIDLVSITEKSWAYLTIKNLLQKKLITASSSEEAIINKRILEMSLTYNFVTPLTSMVATKPEDKEGSQTRLAGDNYPQVKHSNNNPGFIPQGHSSHKAANSPPQQRSSYLAGNSHKRTSLQRLGKRLLHKRNYDLSGSVAQYQNHGKSPSVGSGKRGPVSYDHVGFAEHLLFTTTTQQRYNKVRKVNTIHQGRSRRKNKSSRKVYKKSQRRNRRRHKKKRKNKYSKIKKKCLRDGTSHLDGFVSTQCLKVTGRVTPGLYTIYNTTDLTVTAEFKRGLGRRINGLTTLTVKSQRTILEVHLGRRSQSSHVTSVSHFPGLTVRQNNDEMTVNVTNSDVKVIFYKMSSNYRAKCFDKYFVHVVPASLSSATVKVQGNTMKMFKTRRYKQSRQNKKLDLSWMSPVCNNKPVGKQKLKRPTLNSRSYLGSVSVVRTFF